MHYDDFELTLERADDATYNVQARCRAGRTAYGVFSVEKALHTAGNASRATPFKEVTDLTARFSGDDRVAREIGACLFEQLLSGDVRHLFEEERGRIAGDQTRGLRLELRIPGPDHHSRSLLEWPWELMYCPREAAHLALLANYSIVRFLDVHKACAGWTGQRPLRVLVVAPAPRWEYGSGPLPEVESERRSIHLALAPHDDIEVEYLVPPTITALRERLSTRPCDILHYMGHGFVDACHGGAASSAGLILEADDRCPDEVPSDYLGLLLRRNAQPRLVVLNACNTANEPPGAARPAFRGVAPSLIQAGIPAVIAMRHEILDVAASVFAKVLYSRLFNGAAIDAAMVEARLELLRTQPNSAIWAIPSLFLRIDGSEIFSAPGSRQEAMTAYPAAQQNMTRQASTNHESPARRSSGIRIKGMTSRKTRFHGANIDIEDFTGEETEFIEDGDPASS